MDYLDKFKIQFQGLQHGDNQYSYEIEDKFFDKFENSLIHKGQVHLNLNIAKQDQTLLLQFGFEGKVELECDRCLGLFTMDVLSSHNMVVKLTDEKVDEEDEIVVLPHNAHEINIAQHIYDYLSLQIPYRKVHPDDEKGKSTCDPEFLKNLEKLSHHEENHNDPRWEALKKIKLN